MSKFRHAAGGAGTRRAGTQREGSLCCDLAFAESSGWISGHRGWKAKRRLKVRSMDVFPAVEPGIDGPGARSHHRQARAEHGQHDGVRKLCRLYPTPLVAMGTPGSWSLRVKDRLRVFPNAFVVISAPDLRAAQSTPPGSRRTRQHLGDSGGPFRLDHLRAISGARRSWAIPKKAAN